MKKTTLSVIFVLFSLLAKAQSAYIPYDKDYYHLIGRYEILQGKFTESFHTGFKPYTREAVAAFTDSLSLRLSGLSEADRFNIAYLANDNWEFSDMAENASKKPFLKQLYTKTTDFYHVEKEGFYVRVNPMLNMNVGKEAGETAIPFTNTRGIRFHGMIDDKIGFHSTLTSTQLILPTFGVDLVDQRATVPQEGVSKRVDYDMFNATGYDFFTATGHITFDVSKSINLQFGHDRNFIGEGLRSMLMSDFSSNYLFLKFNTNIWKLQYTNVFAEMTGGFIGSRGQFRDGLTTKKYVTLHRLGMNIRPNLNVGLFERVISERINLAYFNPIIFYRYVEHNLGTPDNVALGIDFKWNFLNQFQAYGQFTFDEFVFSEVFGGRKWWGNKHAVQLGVKYIDALQIKNLDLQLEYNHARPYLFAARDSVISYTNFNQPIAHPAGANFREVIGSVRYQPFKRLQVTANAFYLRTGEDTADTNWGGDLLKNRDTRERTYGNFIGQGVRTDLFYGQLQLSYQVRHNLFLEFNQIIRQKDSALPERNSSVSVTSVGIRLNAASRDLLF
ncbi:hypothetical protein [Penaeicola halotolerans]|uniref:hypothetical protein n=1 Tax=Penaeicola halotolerans TaxID=2793196 RepID=UPI001CF8800B|nr:hypothetical protein [Penaeicola halotolerans]